MSVLFKNGPVTVYLPDRLPIRIDPIDDEAVSSWITRVATFYHLRPWDLLCASNAGPALNLHDLDEQAPELLLESLSRLTGVGPDTIEALTQRRRHPELDKRWLRYLTDELAHCDACLSEMHDKHGFAYLKADWQLRCVTTCHVHRIPLISVCRNCRNSVSLEYIENRNRWEVICRRCSLKEVEQPVQAFSHSVALHFIIELEQLLIDSLRTNESYLHPFNGGDARSLMCAILDMLELNGAKRNILAHADTPIMLSWVQAPYTELQYDFGCLLDVLQMTADKKTLQYICGDIPPWMFTMDSYYCEARSRLMRVSEDDIPAFLERRQKWPSALQRLAERTWIAAAEARAKARYDNWRDRTLRRKGTGCKAPSPKQIYQSFMLLYESAGQFGRKPPAEDLGPTRAAIEEVESGSRSIDKHLHRRDIEEDPRRSSYGWRRPSSAELRPYAEVIEEVTLELTARGGVSRPDEIQKAAFRRMRENLSNSGKEPRHQILPRNAPTASVGDPVGLPGEEAA
jgi:hypothetical protein